MLDKIIFYNFWHCGDIHVSRSLVKFVVDNIPAKEYYYYHPNSSKLIQDIPKLIHIKQNLHEKFIWKGWYKENEILYCNTWYNAYEQQEFQGCTIQTLFKIFKRGLKETINYNLPGNPIDYLPKIYYQYYIVESIIKFLNEDNNFVKPKILISNCNVLSVQSHNFDFNPIINYLSEKFLDITFIITNRVGRDIIKDNVIYARDITKTECDLNEIAYLSEFCSVLIGRCSGPHTFCFTKNNLMDKNKTFICLSRENFGIIGMVKSTMVCSQNYDRDAIAALLELTIKKEYLL